MRQTPTRSITSRAPDQPAMAPPPPPTDYAAADRHLRRLQVLSAHMAVPYAAPGPPLVRTAPTTASTASTATTAPSFCPQTLYERVALPSAEARSAVKRVVRAMTEGERARRLFGPHTSYDTDRAHILQITNRRIEYLVRDCRLWDCHSMQEDYQAHFHALATAGVYDYGLCVRLSLQFNFFAGSLINLGTERHCHFLPHIDSLQWEGCFAITEVAHGSNVRGIQTRARYNRKDRSFTLSSSPSGAGPAKPQVDAAKWWIGNASRAHFCITFAQLYLDYDDESCCKGVHLFIVPIRDVTTGEILPGVTIGDCGPKAGLHSVDNGFIFFDGVRVPRENLLNKYSDVKEDGTFVSKIKSDGQRFGAMLGELVMGRTGLVYASHTLTSMALSTAIKYSANRKQFSPVHDGSMPEMPVLDYQAQRMKLIPSLAASYAFLFAGQHALTLFAKRRRSTARELHIVSAGLKAVTTTHAQDILVMCRRACGGHGYSASSRFGELKNDQDITMTFEGDNTVLLQEVARNLLQDFSRQYNSYGQFVGTLKFITEGVSTYFEYRSLRNTSHTDLTDPDFYLHLLSVRAYRLVKTGALRLQHHMAKNAAEGRLNEQHAEGTVGEKEQKKEQARRRAYEKFSAFNHVQQHLVDAAEAYTERKIAALFVKAVRRCDDSPEIQTVLGKLSALYALNLIEKRLSFYLLHHCISESCARKIRPQVIQLCNDLAPDAVSLCDAFSLPDQLVDTPLSKPLYGEYFERQLHQFQLFGNASQETAPPSKKA